MAAKTKGLTASTILTTKMVTFKTPDQLEVGDVVLGVGNDSPIKTTDKTNKTVVHENDVSTTFRDNEQLLLVKKPPTKGITK